jgi:hypothetical protein
VLVPEETWDKDWETTARPNDETVIVSAPVYVLPRTLTADEAVERVLAYLSS